MKITYTPINGLIEQPEIARHGETFTINGAAFDLSGIPAGTSLPIPHQIVTSARRDEDGTLHVTVPRFYWGDAAPDETTEDLPDSGVWEGEVTVVAPPPEPTQAEKDATNALTPAQFTYMLALNDWEDVWAAAEAYLKANDRAEYAKLAAQKSARTYRLSATLAFVAAMEPVLTAAGVSADLSETTIRAAWADAAGFNG